MQTPPPVSGTVHSPCQLGDNMCEFIDQSSITEVNKVLYSHEPVTNNIWSLKAEKAKLEGVKKMLLAKQQQQQQQA
mgnify:CR=1 FL=1